MSGGRAEAAQQGRATPRVLIADGNGGRGRRLGRACSTAGIPYQGAYDGVSALNWSLAECPAVVVAELGLPLVDAEKLAQILRANPRTRSVRFLFLGERSTRHSLDHVGDVLLPLSSAPNDVLMTIEEMLRKQDRIDAIEEASSSGATVDGELSELSLAELLERFHVGGQSGRLTLEAEVDGEQVTGQVTIAEGDIIHAEVGRIENEKALFRLLSWSMGHFGFRLEEVHDPPSIRTPTPVLLTEGMRQLSEWDRLAPQLPPLDSRVSLRISRSELPNVVHPLTREVLGLVEAYSTVGDVVDRSIFPDYQVLSTLHTLAERKIVELSRVALPDLVLAAGEQGSVLQEGQGRRLLEWLQGGRSGGLVARNAKLIVVSSEPAALHDFTRLIDRVPEVELLDTAAQDAGGGVTANDLAVFGRIAIDETLGIELLHVPIDPRFAPLWPLAGYGALGTLFLLSGPVSEAAERVRSMSERLRRLPGSRLFHVIQFRKDERVSLDDLRDNLALIDEASLILLPLESGKSPASLLGRLLARVIP